MAELKPEVNFPAVPDLNFSRGPNNFAGSALEDLGRGLGGALTDFSKAREAGIEAEIDAAFASENGNLFSGVSSSSPDPSAPGTATSESLTSDSSVPGAPTQRAIPSEIANIDSQLRAYNQAIRQNSQARGVASMRAQATAKRLMAKYPSYRGAILRKFKDERKILLDERARREKLMGEAAEFGVPNPQLLDNQTLILETNQRKAKVFQDKTNKDALEMRLKERKAGAQDVKDYMNTSLTGLQTQLLSDTFKEGDNAPRDTAYFKVTQAIKAYSSEGSDGGKALTPQEITELNIEIENMARGWEQIFLTHTQQMVGGKSVTAWVDSKADLEFMRDSFMAPIKTIKDHVNNGNIAALNLMKDMNALRAEQITAIIAQHLPEAGVSESLQKMLGPEWGQSAIAKTLQQQQNWNKTTNEQAQAILRQVALMTAGGQSNKVFGVLNAARVAGLGTKAEKSIILENSRILALGHQDKDISKRALQSAFTNQALQFFAGNYNDEDQKAIFERYSSPALTREVLRINDDGLTEQYLNWMKQGFNVLHQQTVNSLQEAIINDSIFDVIWDDQSMTFKAIGTGTPQASTTAFDIINSMNNIPGIKDVNKFLIRMKPIFEAQGNSKEEIAAELHDMLRAASPNFNPNEVNSRTTALSRTMSALASYVLGGPEEGSENTAGTQSSYNPSVIPKGRQQVADLIIQRFAEAGLEQHHQIAALANALAESRLNPSAHNTTGEDSVGLFQLNRQRGLGTGFERDFLKVPENNIRIILDAAMKDKEFRNATTLEEAVRAFVYNVERPADKPGQTRKRLKIARQLLG
jgi:hypothetical protein